MIDKTQLDNYILGLAKIRDKEINKILRKHIRKAGNKANTEVKHKAKATAKSKNNGLNEKSYLRTYKRGKVVNRGCGNWTVRIFNQNNKAHFLEKERFHHGRHGIAATHTAKEPANQAFTKYMNEAVNDIIKELGK